MRDPKRIDVVLATLRVYMERNPDIRVGQILGNVAQLHHVDVFFLEDTKVLEYLNAENDRQASQKLNVMGKRI